MSLSLHCCRRQRLTPADQLQCHRLRCPIWQLAREFFSAIAIRVSALLGIPSSSMVRPITDTPNSLTTGRTASSDFSSPFTEFTRGFPGTTASAAAIALWLAESRHKGTSTISETSLATSGSTATSSIPGTPTLTSRMSAPASRPGASPDCGRNHNRLP